MLLLHRHKTRDVKNVIDKKKSIKDELYPVLIMFKMLHDNNFNFNGFHYVLTNIIWFISSALDTIFGDFIFG